MDTTHETHDLRQRVEDVLSTIRPYLRADGGDVELVNVDAEGTVFVRLSGACRGCPGALMTLRAGIERIVREQVPEVRGVEAVR
jgi:Fe-S cluster biogenesis protein NfuA